MIFLIDNIKDNMMEINIVIISAQRLSLAANDRDDFKMTNEVDFWLVKLWEMNFSRVNCYKNAIIQGSSLHRAITDFWSVFCINSCSWQKIRNKFFRDDFTLFCFDFSMFE